MWWKIVLFIIAIAAGFWVEIKIMSSLIAQHPELNKEEES